MPVSVVVQRGPPAPCTLAERAVMMPLLTCVVLTRDCCTGGMWGALTVVCHALFASCLLR